MSNGHFCGKDDLKLVEKRTYKCQHCGTLWRVTGGEKDVNDKHTPIRVHRFNARPAGSPTC